VTSGHELKIYTHIQQFQTHVFFTVFKHFEMYERVYHSIEKTRGYAGNIGEKKFFQLHEDYCFLFRMHSLYKQAGYNLLNTYLKPDQLPHSIPPGLIILGTKF